MESNEGKYTCIREKQLAKHENDLVELKTMADFKNLRIDELTLSVKDMDKKLDKITESIHELKLQSAQDDSSIDKRVESLENTLKVLKWVTGLAISVLSIVVTIVIAVISHIH